MSETLQRAIDAVTAQQPKVRDAVWMVGEQLKDLLRGEPALADIVLEDLTAKKDSLASCKKKIKAYADKHRTGSFACVIPSVAEQIIREHFGLPKRGETPSASEPAASDADGGLVDLDSFF